MFRIRDYGMHTSLYINILKPLYSIKRIHNTILFNNIYFKEIKYVRK